MRWELVASAYSVAPWMPLSRRLCCALDGCVHWSCLSGGREQCLGVCEGDSCVRARSLPTRVSPLERVSRWGAEAVYVNATLMRDSPDPYAPILLPLYTRPQHQHRGDKEARKCLRFFRSLCCGCICTKACWATSCFWIWITIGIILLTLHPMFLAIVMRMWPGASLLLPLAQWLLRKASVSTAAAEQNATCLRARCCMLTSV